MKLFLTDTNEMKEISLRVWANNEYSPDCFSDLETNIPQTHKMLDLDGDTAYCVTSEEYADLVAFWGEECRCMTSGETGQNGDDYSELAPAGAEYVLLAD